VKALAPLPSRLGRLRLKPLWARASVGFGDRPTRDKGAGMEFADYRPYEAGDDLRHLDPHLFARLGEHHVRQFEVQRQLSVTILIDASRSMACDGGRRLDAARDLAGLLGQLALAGNDVVRIGLCSGGGVDWSPRFSGASRSASLLGWLARTEGRQGSFRGCLRKASQDIGSAGLTIVLSDWWDGPPWDLDAIASAGQEPWALHLLLPEDLDPELQGDGALRMVDAESGAEFDIVLDATTIERYRSSFAAWRGELETVCQRLRGRYLTVPVGTALDALLLGDWRKRGVIG